MPTENKKHTLYAVIFVVVWTALFSIVGFVSGYLVSPEVQRKNILRLQAEAYNTAWGDAERECEKMLEKERGEL